MINVWQKHVEVVHSFVCSSLPPKSSEVENIEKNEFSLQERIKAQDRWADDGNASNSYMRSSLDGFHAKVVESMANVDAQIWGTALRSWNAFPSSQKPRK